MWKTGICPSNSAPFSAITVVGWVLRHVETTFGSLSVIAPPSVSLKWKGLDAKQIDCEKGVWALSSHLFSSPSKAAPLLLYPCTSICVVEAPFTKGASSWLFLPSIPVISHPILNSLTPIFLLLVMFH